MATGEDPQEKRWLSSQEAIDHIRESYGLTMTKPTLHRAVRLGRLHGIQPSGERGWWLISRESIDRFYGALTAPPVDNLD